MTRGGFKLRAVHALCMPVRCHRVLALILRCTKSELLCCAVLRGACAVLVLTVCLCCACAVHAGALPQGSCADLALY